MSQPHQSGGFTKNLLLVVLIPLLVAIVGGLLVEYLKPSPSYTPQGTQDTCAQKPSPSTSLAPQIRKLLVRKWNIIQQPTMYGDLQVEFTDYGQVIRTYYRTFIPDEVTTHPYEVTEDGQ